MTTGGPANEDGMLFGSADFDNSDTGGILRNHHFASCDLMSVNADVQRFTSGFLQLQYAVWSQFDQIAYAIMDTAQLDRYLDRYVVKRRKLAPVGAFALRLIGGSSSLVLLPSRRRAWSLRRLPSRE